MAIYYLLCPCCQQNLRTVSSHPHLILSCDKCTLHWQLKMIEAGRFLVKYDTETQKADDSTKAAIGDDWEGEPEPISVTEIPTNEWENLKSLLDVHPRHDAVEIVIRSIEKHGHVLVTLNGHATSALKLVGGKIKQYPIAGKP